MSPRLRDHQADTRLKQFGENVRQKREAGGRSQEAFAHDSGLHRTYIGAIERGEVNASLLNIYRIADALEIEAGQLLG